MLDTFFVPKVREIFKVCIVKNPGKNFMNRYHITGADIKLN